MTKIGQTRGVSFHIDFEPSRALGPGMAQQGGAPQAHAQRLSPIPRICMCQTDGKQRRLPAKDGQALRQGQGKQAILTRF